MHLFVPPVDIEGRHAVVRGDEAHHLVRVLRAGPGDPLTVADSEGTVWDARVANVAPRGDEVRVALGTAHQVPPEWPAVRVVHALPKGRKLDEVVQRLTELGVDRISPVHSARSQVRLDAAKAAKAHRRWSAVGLAAAKQSRRARLPVIDGVGEWAAVDWSGAGAVLWEEADVPLRAVLGWDGRGGTPPEAVFTLAVGPEGGLTADEVAATGLPPVTLGPTILRTEFASVAGVAAAMTLLGRFA